MLICGALALVRPTLFTWFSGSLITELIFGIPGVSSFALQALSARDFPVITTLALIGAGMLVTVNLLVDILYAVIDPRITYD